MLKNLKFVMGAVSKKGFIPELTHFKIENNKIRSFNGTLALSAPFELNINCMPQAEPFIKAIQNCEETVVITTTATGKLSIKSGNFKALVSCLTEDKDMHVLPSGVMHEINGEALVAGLKAVFPFIGDDASRPWSNGALLSANSLYATNNIIIVQYWLGEVLPQGTQLNVPRTAIKELIRVDTAPYAVQLDANSITFHYENDKWIRTQLLSTEWPKDRMEQLFDKFTLDGVKPLPQNFSQSLTKMKPFVDKLARVYLRGNILSTQANENDQGAEVSVEGLNANGCYNVDMLQLVEQVQAIDLTKYPEPCPFINENMRGFIIGMLL